MPKYLYRKTSKHWTKYHLLAPDGLHSLCKRSAGIVAGQRGWQVVEVEKLPFDGLCWHCFTMTQPKAVKLAKWQGE